MHGDSDDQRAPDHDTARSDGGAPRLRDRHAADSPSLPAHTGPTAADLGREAVPVVDRTLARPGDADGVASTASETKRRRTPSAVQRHRMTRKVLRGAALVALGLSIYGLVSLAQVWMTGRSDDRDAVDAIVVMGAAQYDGRPSPQLAARLDHVIELWPDDIAPLVVVTGGNIPGDRFTEAQASAEYLIERGVPEAAVLMEDEGSNSYESLESVAAVLGERGATDVVIVTDPFHSLRSKLIAEELGLDASVSSTDTSVVTGLDSGFQHVKEAGGVAIGRLIGFERLTAVTG